MPFGLSKIVKVSSTALLAVLAVFTGAAVASVPDSDGTVHGCYTTSSGALRVVDPASGGSCHGYETSISWGQPQAGVKYFTGSDTIGSCGSGCQSLTETCPDSELPVSLWVNGSNVLASGGAGSYFSEGLVYPNNDSTKSPYGLSVRSNTLPPANSTVSYSLVCS